ncbi:YopX family protein [Mammaliicoccus sciuri]|uniref:YopX family protein n=1 Tax=Mammaliicoccus sciuri TaxID=1296 RepID=UPI002737D022|nr:YopX family protein [Mammaliicoccus sciuri]
MIPKVIAWDKFDKEMLDVHGINYDADGVWTKEAFDEEDTGDFIHFSDIELLQSSGLTDYHCDEYFEGYIARDVTSKVTGVVEYVEGAFVLRFASGESVYLREVKDEFEIIGNKFEDGYLLGED